MSDSDDSPYSGSDSEVGSGGGQRERRGALIEVVYLKEI